MTNKITKWSWLAGATLTIFAICVSIIIPEIRMFFGLETSHISLQPQPVTQTNSSHESNMQPKPNPYIGVEKPKYIVRQEIQPLKYGGIEVEIRRNRPEETEKRFGGLIEEKELILPANSN